MVSITHFEELKPSELLESLDVDWIVTEKMDGSYLRAGLDENGRFYTQRKNAPPCYSISDWSDEAWAQAFRSGHTMAELLVNHLMETKGIRPHGWIDFELIYGDMPNTIPYVLPKDVDHMAIITSTNELRWDHDASQIFRFNSMFSIDQIMSMDGVDRTEVRQVERWTTGWPMSWPADYSKARLRQSANRLKKVLEDWFPRESKVEGFSILEVLEINLSRKHPNCGDRVWADIKPLLKDERAELQDVFLAMVMVFKDLVLRVFQSEIHSSIGAGSFTEGYVVERQGKLFKFVDRDVFGEANKFVHLIKYWLVGGSRPPRPCFLSRTKDWPMEKRLARLDLLLRRYQDHRWVIHFTLRDGLKRSIISYSGDLHQRTLNLFADTRKRIIDGR